MAWVVAITMVVCTAGCSPGVAGVSASDEQQGGASDGGTNPGSGDRRGAGDASGTDNLDLVTSMGSPVETVGVHIVDDMAFTCGGFGMDAFRIGSSGYTGLGSALTRCQNILAGGSTSDGQRVLYVSHHGDAYVPTGGLYVVQADPDTGHLAVTQSIEEIGTSFEGGTIVGDRLWIGLHGAGVRRYDIGPEGTLTEVDTLTEGFDNAWRMTHDGATLYVADGNDGLKIVDPGTGAVIGAASTAGFAKDVVVTNGMAFVAASTLGVHVFDVSDPTSPTSLDVVFTHGTALDVALFGGGQRVAVANLVDVTVIDASDPQSVQVVAVDRGTDKSGQTPRHLSIGADDDIIAAGEWLGLGMLRWVDGPAGPEFHAERQTLSVGGVDVGASADVAVNIVNRGPAQLEITSAVLQTDVFTVSPTTLSIAAGEMLGLALTFTPSKAGEVSETLTLTTNDPDEQRVVIDVVGNPTSAGLNVGDALTDDFDFLDVASPAGDQEIGNLQGNVLLLAYFATF